MLNPKKNFHTKEKDMAKAITPKEAANLLTKKRGRGRPRKVPKTDAEHIIEMMEHIKTPKQIETFNQALERMDAEAAHEANIQRLISERAPVHWEEVAQKQEVELNVLRQENEELARICVQRWETIEDWKKLVKYLEGRVEDLTIRSR